MRYFWFVIAVTIVAGGCFFRQGNAADPMAAVPVADRKLPEFQAMGLRLGSIMLYPSLETGVGYTSNVFQTRQSAQSDRIYTIAPSIEIRKKLPRGYDVRSYIGLSRKIYADHTTQNHMNYTASMDIGGNVARIAKWRFKGLVGRHHETNADRYDASLTRPVAVDRRQISVLLQSDSGRLGWGGRMSYADVSYSDGENRESGEQIINRDRDHVAYDVGAKITFDSRQKFSPFIGLNAGYINFDRRDYLDGMGFSGVNQDKMRYGVYAGVVLRPHGLWRGMAKAGYGIELFDDKSVDNRSTHLAAIDLTYLYSPLTNFTFGVDRFFADDTADAYGTIKTTLSTSVIHELTRQWALRAGLFYEMRDFARYADDKSIGGYVAADYKINDKFRLGGEVRHVDRESNRANGGYDETRAYLRLKTSL